MISPRHPEEPVSGHSLAPFERQVQDRIQTLSYLPTAVSVALRFIALGKEQDAEPADYLRVISSDSSLSTKLLALANSSWFGVRHRVTKPGVALNLLGLSTVRTLAISYCAAGLHHGLRLSPQEARVYWAASLSKAVACRQWMMRCEPELAEEAFACGLFQDLALPFMYSVARDELQAYLQQGPEIKEQLQHERALFRLDHAELGRGIAQKIELPQLFVDAIALHHQPAALRHVLPSATLAEAVELASLFPHLLERWNSADAQLLHRFVQKERKVDVQAYLSEVQREFDQLYAYFENGAVSESNLHELLQQALEQIADNTTRLVGTVHHLMHETAQAGQEARKAFEDQRHMEAQVLHDPLTGLLNRSGFARHAAELLTREDLAGAPLAVAFLDIDRFKRINDTVGHAAGDDTLRALAAVLQRYCRHDDLAGRIGGDEFVLVLPRCSRDDAVSAVQRILDNLAAQTVGSAAQKMPITVSAGLVWVAAGAQPDVLERLIAESDRLMYQAKRAGGNRLQWRGAENCASAVRAAS